MNTGPQPPNDVSEVRESPQRDAVEAFQEVPTGTTFNTAHSARSEVIFYDNVVPLETRQAVIEQQLAMEQDKVKRLGEQARAASRIGQKYREKLRNLVGAKKYEQIRAYRADRRREQAKLFLPPQGSEMSQREVEEIRSSRQEELVQFVRKLGVDVEQIKDLRRQVGDRLAETLLPPAPPTGEEVSVQLLRPEEVPSAIRADRTTAPVAGKEFFSPFSSTVTLGPYGSGSRITLESTLYLRPEIGSMGNSNRLWNTNADDQESGSQYYGTSIGVYYQMPFSGRFEVWLAASMQLVAGHHHLNLWDEWGESWSFGRQLNYLTLSPVEPVNNPGPWWPPAGHLKMSRFEWMDQTSGSWDEHYQKRARATPICFGTTSPVTPTRRGSGFLFTSAQTPRTVA